MKKILVVMFLVFALVSWGCDGGKKTLSGDEEGIILIEERTLSEEEIEEECPNGGVKIVTGFDKNGNGGMCQPFCRLLLKKYSSPFFRIQNHFIHRFPLYSFS